MRKIYHLSSCNTNQRIINDLDLYHQNFEFQNIKEKNISAEALDKIAKSVGSYEALFSKRARKYKSLGLDKIELSEQDYRKYILEEYTFLKRPYIAIDGAYFIGNAKKTIAAAAEKLRG